MLQQSPLCRLARQLANQGRLDFYRARDARNFYRNPGCGNERTHPKKRAKIQHRYFYRERTHEVIEEVYACLNNRNEFWPNNISTRIRLENARRKNESITRDNETVLLYRRKVQKMMPFEGLC